MINYWKTNSEMFPDPKTLNFIVPVPLHPRRRRERGFNQSELLAAAIGGAFRLPVRKILKRQRSDPPQSTLGIKERQKNIRGAFSVTGLKSLDGTNTLLIDDIFTTGATASECARTLKEHGADAVYVYTLARRDFQ
jgi:ComF family protein